MNPESAAGPQSHPNTGGPSSISDPTLALRTQKIAPDPVITRINALIRRGIRAVSRIDFTDAQIHFQSAAELMPQTPNVIRPKFERKIKIALTACTLGMLESASYSDHEQELQKHGGGFSAAVTLVSRAYLGVLFNMEPDADQRGLTAQQREFLETFEKIIHNVATTSQDTAVFHPRLLTEISECFSYYGAAESLRQILELRLNRYHNDIARQHPSYDSSLLGVLYLQADYIDLLEEDIINLNNEGGDPQIVAQYRKDIFKLLNKSAGLFATLSYFSDNMADTPIATASETEFKELIDFLEIFNDLSASLIWHFVSRKEEITRALSPGSEEFQEMPDQRQAEGPFNDQEKTLLEDFRALALNFESILDAELCAAQPRAKLTYHTFKIANERLATLLTNDAQAIAALTRQAAEFLPANPEQRSLIIYHEALSDMYYNLCCQFDKFCEAAEDSFTARTKSELRLELERYFLPTDAITIPAEQFTITAGALAEQAEASLDRYIASATGQLLKLAGYYQQILKRSRVETHEDLALVYDRLADLADIQGREADTARYERLAKSYRPNRHNSSENSRE